jgi:hypothetical protein
MKRLYWLTLLAAGAAPLHANSIVDGTTLSGSLGYNTNNVYVYITNGYNPLLPAWINNIGGIEFTPSSNFTLESLIVPLYQISGTSQVTFTLYSGNSTPATVLDSVSMTLPTGWNLDTFNFNGDKLQAGQNYFLIGSVPGSTSITNQVDWAGNTASKTVPFLSNQEWLTGTYAGYGYFYWATNDFGNGPAWQIAADPGAPEPATFLLIGCGLVAVGVVRAKGAVTARYARSSPASGSK